MGKFEKRPSGQPKKESNEKVNGGSSLAHVSPSTISRAGRKPDKKGSSGFSFKKVFGAVIVIVGIAAAIPCINKQLSVPEIPYSVADTLAVNANDTYLDEVLEQQAKEKEQASLLEQVTQLELYLDMYGKLKDLHLSSYTDAVIEVEETADFNNELERKYEEFVKLSKDIEKDVLSEDAIRLYHLAAELKGYKAVVDSKIISDGYDIFAQYGKLVAKTAVLDASGISYTNIGNLTIPYESDNYVIEYKDPTTGKVFTINISGNSIIHRVMNNIYRAQTKDPARLTTAEIVADLTEYLNDAKVATFMRYGYENDGTLYTINDYGDVRDAIEDKPKIKTITK